MSDLGRGWIVWCVQLIPQWSPQLPDWSSTCCCNKKVIIVIIKLTTMLWQAEHFFFYLQLVGNCSTYFSPDVVLYLGFPSRRKISLHFLAHFICSSASVTFLIWNLVKWWTNTDRRRRSDTCICCNEWCLYAYISISVTSRLLDKQVSRLSLPLLLKLFAFLFFLALSLQKSQTIFVFL